MPKFGRYDHFVARAKPKSLSTIGEAVNAVRQRRRRGSFAFSTVGGEKVRGTPSATPRVRRSRFTEEGNWEMTGKHTPVFSFATAEFGDFHSHAKSAIPETKSEMPYDDVGFLVALPESPTRSPFFFPIAALPTVPPTWTASAATRAA